MSIQLEEKLLWKMLGFLSLDGGGSKDGESHDLEMESDDGERNEDFGGWTELAIDNYS